MGCIRESAQRRAVGEAAKLIVPFVVVALTGGHLVQAAQQPPPVLRTGVDMVTIDVQVAAVKDAEMRELTAADFVITISGRKRKTASASFMHYDQGTVIRNPAAAGANGPSPECVFGFHRTENRKTAHYLIGVDRTGADQTGVKDVRVSIGDKSLVVQRSAWRSPIHKSAASRVAR